MQSNRCEVRVWPCTLWRCNNCHKVPSNSNYAGSELDSLELVSYPRPMQSLFFGAGMHAACLPGHEKRGTRGQLKQCWHDVLVPTKSIPSNRMM